MPSSGDQASPPQPKSLTAKAIDKVKEVAKSAGDIFSRVPCLPPKGGVKPMGSLPHVAGKLAAGEPVVIVAFGSSSTQGYGTTSPEFTYPNRLAGAAAPAISDRRHHRRQSRQGRRGRAGNDEAAADRGDRHEARSGDLAGRHQRRAAQSRSRRDREAGGGRRRAHSGRRRRCGAGRSAIFAEGHRARGERQQDGQAARQGRRAAPCRHFSALRGDARVARTAGAADRQFRDRRRPAHERLGLRLLRATARRRHHQVGRPDQARRQRAGQPCRPIGRCEASE